MIVLSTSAAQTIQPAQAATFDLTVLHTGCGEYHRAGAAATCLRSNGVYSLSFNGNVGGAAATQPNLAIAVNGGAMPETTMTATITAATDVFNVSASTRLRAVPGCCDSITVINTGTTPVILEAGASLDVSRVG